MSKDIEEIEITIFDTETTGLDPAAGDRIVEIAAMRVLGDKVLGEYHSLVNPHREISPGAFAVNKITPEMLMGAPSIEKILPEFIDFSKNSCLCSYNVPFDLGFLRKEFPAAGAGFLQGVLFFDVLIMARRVFPFLERHALWFVAQSLGIQQQQEHRAGSDVDMTWRVFQKIKKVLRDKGVADFDHYMSLFGIQGPFLEDIMSKKTSMIQEAIDTGMRLRIKYISSSEAQVSSREVLPKEIRRDKRYIYMIGLCFLKNEDRMFRLDGILDMEIVD